MSLKKSLTVIRLFALRIWHRTRSPLQRMHLDSVSPETPASHPPPAVSLPQEIVEMITAHLVYDKYTLLACCLTCRSWYIASVAKLHHTLITPTIRKNGKPWWPDSFRDMHKLGLFPLVKRLQVQGSHFCPYTCTFSPGLFDRRTLHQFSSLTNIRELGIDDLDITGFMPNIRLYFNHFLPTVQSLALRRPRGSCRQIVFFIGLFQHLEDLKLLNGLESYQQWPPDDLTLIPPFAPPLQGWFTIRNFSWVRILGDMVDLFGGVRFHHVELWWKGGVQPLLDACAETLETLWFRGFGPYCEGVSLKWVQVGYVIDDFSANPFDLSQNKLLRALKLPIIGIGQMAEDPRFIAILRHALSTITSPTFSEVIISYNGFGLPIVFCSPPCTPCFSLIGRREWHSRHRVVFGMLRRMRGIRYFELVLCVDGYGPEGDGWARALEFALDATCVEGGSDSISPRPFVTHSPEFFLPAPGEEPVHVPPCFLPWAPK